MSAVRTGILLHSALAGAAIGLVAALLALGVVTIAVHLLPLPAGAARLLERRGPTLALACIAASVLVGATLGWLEGRLKTH